MLPYRDTYRVHIFEQYTKVLPFKLKKKHDLAINEKVNGTWIKPVLQRELLLKRMFRNVILL